MLDPNCIGKNIRKYREKLNITQQGLAELLFVSFQAISAWERGLSLPDLENASKLARIFNVKLDTLLAQEDSNLFIAVDGGGTKTEFILFEKNGTVRKRIVLQGSNPNDCGFEKSVAVLSQGIDEMISPIYAKSVFAGIAGVTAGDHIPNMEKSLTDKYGITVNVASDSVNVLCLNENIADCASVICGTGSCVFVRKNFKLTRIGGWGYLFDRGGSGYDIGNDAIRHALAVKDGMEEPTILSRKVEEKLGGDIWKNLSEIYKQGKAYVASFAPLVSECEALGDVTSLNILQRNAKHLADLLNLAIDKHNSPHKFVCAGGFFKDNTFKQRVESMTKAKLITPDLPPVYGAAVECMRLNGLTLSEDFKNNFKESYR